MATISDRSECAVCGIFERKVRRPFRYCKNTRREHGDCVETCEKTAGQDSQYTMESTVSLCIRCLPTYALLIARSSSFLSMFSLQRRSSLYVTRLMCALRVCCLNSEPTGQVSSKGDVQYYDYQ